MLKHKYELRKKILMFIKDIARHFRYSGSVIYVIYEIYMIYENI